MAAITSANQAAGGRIPTSPARAAHPKSAPAEAPANTRYRPRGNRCRSAIRAHAATPTPAAITTRCMTSTARLTAGVYAAQLACLLERGGHWRMRRIAFLRGRCGSPSLLSAPSTFIAMIKMNRIVQCQSHLQLRPNDASTASFPCGQLVQPPAFERNNPEAGRENLKNIEDRWFPRRPIAHRISPHGRWGPRLQRALSARH